MLLSIFAASFSYKQNVKRLTVHEHTCIAKKNNILRKPNIPMFCPFKTITSEMKIILIEMIWFTNKRSLPSVEMMCE